MSASNSQISTNGNYLRTYDAPPSYQSRSNNEFPGTFTTQDNIQENSSNYTSSPSNGHGPGFDDDQILAQATEFISHVKPLAFRSSHLSKPVAIPQTIPGMGQSFARCWSPALAAYNITSTDFLEFIDNLNVVASASPPLQVLGLVGGVLGMVPHHLFQLAGIGVQAIAKIGTKSVSKSRTDMYMRTVNQEFLGTRGLKATIMSRDAMAISLGFPQMAAQLEMITEENTNSGMLERRLEGLKPYIAELHFDVPPPVQQTSVLAKISASQVARQTARAEKKMLDKRGKQMEKIRKVNEKIRKEYAKEHQKFEEEMMKLDREAEKAQRDAEKDMRKGGRSAVKAERKLTEEFAKIEEQRIKLEKGHVSTTMERSSSSSKLAEKDEENKQAVKALWILIENLKT